MKIIVDNKLTYNCNYDVKVGDTVVVPAPWYMECSTTRGKVTKIGSDYNGYLLDVIRVEK
jgi:hypothetical protein